MKRMKRKVKHIEHRPPCIMSNMEIEKAYKSRERQHPNIPSGINDCASIEYIAGRRILRGGLANPR